jgi:hypothetical protein
MMTTLSRWTDQQGVRGYDDMTMQKRPKYHHHSMKTSGYDDMTKVMVFRARGCGQKGPFAPFFSLSLTRTFKEYCHIVISICFYSMMTIKTPILHHHIVMARGKA